MAASVLIVDDDPGFRALARRLLADCGLVVVGEVDSVADALSAARLLKPTGALVDVELPDGDGLSLARELAALPWQPRIVLTSTYPGVGSTDEVLRHGAQAFIHKGDLPRAPLRRLLGAE
jgi:DNA-binding NarL/FixJ family response regulator